MNTENNIKTISRAIERLYLYTLESPQQQDATSNTAFTSPSSISPSQSNKPKPPLSQLPDIPIPLEFINVDCFSPDYKIMVPAHPSWNGFKNVFFILKEKYIKYTDSRFPLPFLNNNTSSLFTNPYSSLQKQCENQQASLLKLKYYSIMQYNILCRVQRCLELLLHSNNDNHPIQLQPYG